MNPGVHVRRREHGSCAGFTLLEMMVVIILIGILSAAIIPEMKGTFQDALLRSTSRKIAGACNLAYSLSVSRNQIHRVRLDEKNGRYIIERKVNGGPPGAELFRDADTPGSQGELDARIMIMLHAPEEAPPEQGDDAAPPPRPEEPRTPNAEKAIVFYPDGTSDNCEIVLQDKSGFRLALRLNPVTSRIHIADKERE